MSKKTYLVKSGDGYFAEWAGEGIPTLTSSPEDAARIEGHAEAKALADKIEEAGFVAEVVAEESLTAVSPAQQEQKGEYFLTGFVPFERE